MAHVSTPLGVGWQSEKVPAQVQLIENSDKAASEAAAVDQALTALTRVLRAIIGPASVSGPGTGRPTSRK